VLLRAVAVGQQPGPGTGLGWLGSLGLA